MASLVYAPIAQSELAEAYRWYRSQSERVASRFLADLEVMTERIAATPQQFPVVDGTVRRAQLQRFPYALFFRITANDIRIIACFHGSRDPRSWQERS